MLIFLIPNNIVVIFLQPETPHDVSAMKSAFESESVNKSRYQENPSQNCRQCHTKSHVTQNAPTVANPPNNHQTTYIVQQGPPKTQVQSTSDSPPDKENVAVAIPENVAKPEPITTAPLTSSPSCVDNKQEEKFATPLG